MAENIGTGNAIIAAPPPAGLGDKKGFIIETIVLVFATAAAAVTGGMLIQKVLDIEEVNSNQDAKIELARGEARAQQQASDDEYYSEQEKDPRREFEGPMAYGGLKFKYPRTWSWYVENDASKGSNYKAFLSPEQVNSSPNSDETKSALRVEIHSRREEEVVAQYKPKIASGDLKMSVITINGDNNASLYEGFFTKNLQGKAIVFGIRDKTVVLRTDAMIFEKDFDDLIKTITYNK